MSALDPEWTVYDRRTDTTLTESARIFRDAFCREYIKDFNGLAALRRCGFAGEVASARTKCSGLLAEPYVATQLDEMVRALKPTDVVTRGEVMAAMWREANDHVGNPGKVRVAALAHIANMLGMNIHTEKDDSRPIGVLLVPMLAGDDWNIAAETSQRQLKEVGGRDVTGT